MTSALRDVGNPSHWVSRFLPGEVGIIITTTDWEPPVCLLKPGSVALCPTFVGQLDDPWLERAKEHCRTKELQLDIVEVSWDDFKVDMEFLMRAKGRPIGPHDVPWYRCCQRARQRGVKVLFSTAENADTQYIPQLCGLIHVTMTLNESRQASTSLAQETPCATYMRAHFYDVPFVPAVQQHIDEHEGTLTGEQRFTLYVLNVFMRNVVRMS